MPLQQQIVTKQDINQWRARIEVAWQRSVESVIEVGRLINEARDQLGATYALLETELPFSTTVAAFLSKIAKNRVLSNPTNFARLPNGVNTLYHLTFIDETKLEEQIDQGEITPNFTLNEAKALRTTTGTQKASGKAATNPANKEQVEVGTVYMPLPKRLDSFMSDLNDLLDKYQAKMTFSKAGTSLVEIHRSKLHQMALDKIAAAETNTASVDLETIRVLEDAIHFLQKDRAGKLKKVVTIDGKQVERSCLPNVYPDLELLRKWLGMEDIYRGALLHYCKTERIQISYLDVKDVDKEFYIWEQVRLHTSKKDAAGAVKRLRNLASHSHYPNIKKLAAQVLEEVTRFE